jgi:hypothetical protein
MRTRGSIKRDLWEVQEGEERKYTGAERKVYLCSSRARGLLKGISFFIRLIGLEGLSIYNTELENSYDNIL